MALHDGDCVISGVPRYNRREILEALIELVGLDSVIGDLAMIADGMEGYEETSMTLSRLFYVANHESYRSE